MPTPILMYHRVCKDAHAPPSPFVVTASVFERQLQWLSSRGYRGVSAAEIATRPAGPDDERVVALTFDDGYLDNFDVALPLLHEYGFTATIFVVADFSRRINFWDHSIATAGAPLLEQSHIREMAARGISFGSHGDSHERMDALDDVRVATELSRSRDVIEQLLGVGVDSFAYPYGVVDGRTKALARRAGYRSAFAVNSGPLRPEDDPLEIRRVLVGNSASDVYMATKAAGVERALRSQLT